MKTLLPPQVVYRLGTPQLRRMFRLTVLAAAGATTSMCMGDDKDDNYDDDYDMDDENAKSPSEGSVE